MDHYGTPEDALAYHEARGNAAWAGASDALRLAALVRASDALDALYGDRYPGMVSDPAQPLLWPRTGVTYRGAMLADDTIPASIIRATYELALRELATPGSVLPDYDPAGTIKRERKAVGPLQKEVEYAVPVDAAGARPVIGIIDGILGDLLTKSATGTSVTTLARF